MLIRSVESERDEMKFQFSLKSLRWTRKKTVILVVGVCLTGAGSFYFSRQGTTRKNTTQASFIRTTVLKKTTLNNSISLTLSLIHICSSVSSVDNERINPSCRSSCARKSASCR